jgi:hypothetical protein
LPQPVQPIHPPSGTDVPLQAARKTYVLYQGTASAVP